MDSRLLAAKSRKKSARYEWMLSHDRNKTNPEADEQDSLNLPCPICFEPYESSNVTPARYPVQLLPCEHTLCAKCVAYHRTTTAAQQIGKGFRCPYCRESIKSQRIHPSISKVKSIISQPSTSSSSNNNQEEESNNNTIIIRKFAIQREISKTMEKLNTVSKTHQSVFKNLNSLQDAKNSLLSRLNDLEVEQGRVQRYFKELSTSKSDLERTLMLHQQTLESVTDDTSEAASFNSIIK